MEIRVFSDGHLTVPTRLLASNVREAEIKALLGQPLNGKPNPMTLDRVLLELIAKGVDYRHKPIRAWQQAE